MTTAYSPIAAPRTRHRVAETRATYTAIPETPPDYHRALGVDAYVQGIASAPPLVRVAIEREGVEAGFVKDLARRMDIPVSRLFAILGVPRATAEKKAAARQRIGGSGGVAAVGMVRLLGLAQELLDESTQPEAADMDAARWLGNWIEQPQPALGGRRPADLLDTPTGTDIVARLLGSLASGAYQ